MRHIIRTFLAILFLISTSSAQTKITYRFDQPDPWGDGFWTLSNQDDGAWRKVASLDKLNALIAQHHPHELFLRIEMKLTASQINNLYFEARHSAPFQIYVNGRKAGGSTGISARPHACIIDPRRPENIGQNIYAIHFSDTGAASFFEIKIKNSLWRCLDEGAFRPAPVLGDQIRDAQVCAGGDGAWYMTGTTGNDSFFRPGPEVWLRNPGIQVFRSTDRKHWTSLGWVWTFEKDAGWARSFGTFGGRGPARAIFAPEIKYHDHAYWINYSVNNVTDTRSFGIGLLRAERPEGPYTELSPDKPISEGFDSNVFTDKDGTPYLLRQGGEIARLKADYTGIAEPFRHLAAANYPYVGYEGVQLFRYKGRYYLTAAEWNVHADGKISYDSMIASAVNIYGPYSDRYCALRYGGHNAYFTGPDGGVYATVWCYPEGSGRWQQVSIVKMIRNEKGFFHVAN